MTTTTLPTYNGWPNYPTWNVALWMDNDESDYHYARELARTAIGENSTEYDEDITPVPGAELRYGDDGEPIIELATCGVCGRTWNDAAVSGVTPVPAGRCPFEYDHADMLDRDGAITDLADALESWHSDARLELEGFAADVFGWAMGFVDWRHIASHLIDEQAD